VENKYEVQPPSSPQRPLLIRMVIGVVSWVRRRRAAREGKPKSIILRFLKFIIASVAAAALLKVVAEKSFDPMADKVKQFGLNWWCGANAKHEAAKKHQISAYALWDRKDERGFHAEYKKSLTIYEDTVLTCSSKEAAFQLMLANCRGYGTKQNISVGQHYMMSVSDDPRLLDLKKENSRFCLIGQ
jgi:hypothetical protein